MPSPVEGVDVVLNGQRLANAKWKIIIAPEKKGMTPTPSSSLDLFKQMAVNKMLYGTLISPTRHCIPRPEAIPMTSFLRCREEQ